VVVGLDAAPPPPLQFGPPGTPDFKGLEVDLLAAVAAELEWKVVYEVGLWSALLDRLAEGRVDLLCTAATVTAARARRLAFGLGYLSTSLVLTAREHTDIRSTGELAHARVAVRSATVAEDWARAHLSAAELVRFDLNTDAYEALRNGGVDALIDDAPIARWFVSGSRELRIATAIPDTVAEYAMVFARENAGLRIAVDAVLRGMMQTGELEALRRKWLGTLNTHAG
jgi:polar amino acid transport system substrate-binding protein